MSLVTGGEKIGGDVAFSRDVGDDLDFFVHFRKLGEELSFGVALENLGRKAVSAAMSGSETVCVGFVEEDLGLEDCGRLLGEGGVVTKSQIAQDLDGGRDGGAGRGSVLKLILILIISLITHIILQAWRVSGEK